MRAGKCQRVRLSVKSTAAFYDFLHFTRKTRKNRNCNISATVRQISTKFNTMTQNMSLKCTAVENLNVNIPRSRTAAILKMEKLQYFMMTQNESLESVGRLPSWNVKIKFLLGNAHDRHVLHRHAKLCVDRSYCRLTNYELLR